MADSEVLSLAEMKARNAKEEADAQAAAELLAKENAEAAEKAEDEFNAKKDEPESGGEPEKQDDEDDWLESGEELKAEPIDNGTAKAIRLKYQAQTKKERDEADRLRKELEEAKQALATRSSTPATSSKPEPLREAFKTDAEWIKAITEHNVAATLEAQESARLAAKRKADQELIAEKTAVEVDSHYTRVAALAEKSKIAPEVCQSADMSVRQAVADVFGESADAVVDSIIARVGPGSEKAILYLGMPKNKDKLAEVINSLKSDSTGLTTIVKIGRLAERLSAPTKRETTAPQPVEELSGTQPKAGQANAMKKKYQDAHDKGDSQAAFAIRKQAKAAGYSVSTW